jgi:hypothetical protein
LNAWLYQQVASAWRVCAFGFRGPTAIFIANFAFDDGKFGPRACEMSVDVCFGQAYSEIVRKNTRRITVVENAI